MSDPEKLVVRPPLPLLVDFPKSEASNFTLISLGLAAGLFLALAGKVLSLSGDNKISSFLNAIHLFQPRGFLLTLAGVESTLVFVILGQLLTAFAIGWKTIAVSLGPLRIFRRGGGWRFAFNKSLANYAVTSVPRTADCPGWRLPISLAIVPLMLLFSGASSLIAFTRLSGHARLQNYLAAAALFGLSVALLYFVPNSRTALVWNPARYCLAMLTNDPELRNRVVSLRLLGLAQQEERPRDYPIDLIIAAAQPASNETSATMRASAIACWCLDRDDLVSAGAWFDRLAELAERCKADLKNVALASSACFDFAWKGDSETAIRKLKEVSPETLPSIVSRLSAQAVLYLLNSDKTSAEATITQAECDCSGPPGKFALKTLSRLRAIATDIRTD